MIKYEPDKYMSELMKYFNDIGFRHTFVDYAGLTKCLLVRESKQDLLSYERYGNRYQMNNYDSLWLYIFLSEQNENECNIEITTDIVSPLEESRIEDINNLCIALNKFNNAVEYYVKENFDTVIGEYYSLNVRLKANSHIGNIGKDCVDLINKLVEEIDIPYNIIRKSGKNMIASLKINEIRIKDGCIP